MREINIAICDDDVKTCEDVKAAIRRKWKDDPAIVLFQDGEELVSYYREKRQPFDIIVLDIYMNRMDGIRAAQFIRKMDDEVMVIFLTSSPDHLVDGFGVHAFQYITKPLHSDTILDVLSEAVEKVSREEKSIVMKVGRDYERLPLSQLVYVDVSGSYLRFHTVSGTVHKILGTVKGYAHLLELCCISQISDGCMVNLRHVQWIESKRRIIRLRDGTNLLISRSRFADVSSMFYSYRKGL